MNFAEIKARHEAEDAGFYHDHEIIDGRQNRLLGRSDMPGLLVHQDRGWLIEQYEDLYEDNVDLVEQLDAALKLQRYRAVNTRPRWEPVGIEDRYTGAPWMEPHKEGQYVSYASLQAALKPRTVVDALKDLLQAAEDYSAREKP